MSEQKNRIGAVGRTIQEARFYAQGLNKKQKIGRCIGFERSQAIREKYGLDHAPIIYYFEVKNESVC